MSAGTLVGVDVGTTAVKAVAISPRGEVRARCEEHYALATPHPGWTEQGPGEWWDATRAALERLGHSGVAGIGLSGQMHGLVALDGRERVVRPAILWNDQRTGAECDAIERAIGLPRLIELTGNRALTGFTAPKLLWVREHEPEVYGSIRRVMLPKDYVRLRLTGEVATDVTDASGTLLFDVSARSWSAETLHRLEIDAEWMPPALESPQRVGSAFGDVPVAAGAGDQAAAAVGVGVHEPGPVSIALGTSGVVLATLPGYAADELARLHTFCHARPDTWHAMGVMLSAAGSLRWFRDISGAKESFDDLVGEARRWRPGCEGLTFLPYLTGERTPHADPHARGAFVGLAIRHDRGAMTRAVMEGVAYGLRDSFELVASLGQRPEVGRVSGGGARSDTWLEIVASVLGISLQRTAVDEGAAFGAALLGGVAAGIFGGVDEAVASCVRTRGEVEPREEWRATYEEGYARYRALYPALSAVREG